MLDCQSRGSGFKSQPLQKFGLKFLLHLCWAVRRLVNSAIMSTLTIHRQWEDEMVRERTGHMPSYAKAKQMKSITLHSHGYSRANLRDCSFSSSLTAALHHQVMCGR